MMQNTNLDPDLEWRELSMESWLSHYKCQAYLQNSD